MVRVYSVGELTKSGVRISPAEYNSIIAGTWVFATDAGYADNHGQNAGAAANGDGLTYYRGFSGGTYTIRFTSVTNTANGIVKIYLDDVAIATFDLYDAAGPIFSVRFEDTGNSISAGRHKVDVKIDGKNGASAGYVIDWEMLLFEPE